MEATINKLREKGKTLQKQGFFSFKVGYGGTLLAGSRHGSVLPGTSHLLVKALAHFSECGFWVGCAPGIDAAFRQAFAKAKRKRVDSLTKCLRLLSKCYRFRQGRFFVVPPQNDM